MCSYLTVPTDIAGSAKGAQGWFNVTSAQVYFDHPFHAPFDHTLNIDFTDPAKGPGRACRRRAQRGVGAPSRRQHHRGARRCRGRRLLTSPTGPAAGVHLPWAEVPAAVKAWAAARRWWRADRSPRSARRVLAGRGGAARVPAWCGVRQGGRRGAQSRVARACTDARPSSRPRSRRRRPFPVLLDVYDDGGWVALAFEAIEGRLPRHPWDRAELDGVVERPRRGPRRAHPEPGPPSRTGRRPVFRQLFGGWAELGGCEGHTGLDPWCARHLSRLAELEARWPEAIEGPTLVHGDIRSDNILIGPTGPVFVDWPHAAVAPRSSTWSRGRPRWCWRVGPSPKSSWPLTALAACRPRHRLGAPRCSQRVLRGALAAAATTRAFPPCAPSRRRRARWRWPGCAAAPHGDDPHARRESTDSLRGCASDCRSPTSPTARRAPSSTRSSTGRTRLRRRVTTRCG